MTASERQTVVGVFDNRSDAEKAVDELRRAGYTDDQIGFVMRGEDTSAKEGEGAGAGAVGGALTGGAVGGVLGAIAAGLIPGVGPVIAAGILAATLGGAAAGAAAGGIIGALVGAGVPEDDAKYYDEQFREGRGIVTVKAGSRYNDAAEILRRHGKVETPVRSGYTTDRP
jgi:hypothetical protein